MKNKIWTGCLIALFFSAKAGAVPDPRDSVILESKIVAPVSGTGGVVRMRVWITNKDTLTSATLPLIETSVSGGAYMTLARPRTFNGVVAPLTSTLQGGKIFNGAKYNSTSPDSFLVAGLYDPLDPETVEPPNAARKALWDIKFDTVVSQAQVGIVEFDSGQVAQSIGFTDKQPLDVPVNFVKGTVTVSTPCYDFRVSLEHFGPATRGSWRFVRIQCSNAGTCAVPATLIWKAPSQAAAVYGYGQAYPTGGGPSQLVPAGTDGTTRTVTWSFPQIGPGEGFYLWARYQIPCGLATLTPLLTTLRAEPFQFDLDSIDNVDTVRKITMAGATPCNSFGKWNGPAAALTYGEIFGIKAIDTLTYLISFQNLGGGTAANVLVRDSLDSNLNVVTVDSLGTSHPYSFSVSGRELSRNFSGINLPDSTSDGVGSLGFAAFRVGLQPGLPEGTVIQNKALLNFDGGPTFVTSPVTTPVCLAARGDINGNGSLSPADVVAMLNCVYLNPGGCTACADLNCNGGLSPAEVVIELNAVYLAEPIECP